MRKIHVFIALCFVSLSGVAQELQINGNVTGSDGNVLIGANILVKGTNTGTVTDFDGNYTIKSKAGDVLVFTYLGYVGQEVTIGSNTVINVVLQPDENSLDEVVIVGYGTSKRGDLTGAISTVSTKDFDRIPASSPLQTLQGRASGLQITSDSGVPGAGGKVLIRGVGSINGSTSPIYVVDGVITDNIDNLNPNSIESISVLKDASSAAIYGARAANGVILVATKRGKSSQDTQVTLNTYTGVQTQSNLSLKLLNADQFLQLWTESYQNAGIDLPWNDATIAEYNGVDTDWLDLMTQSGQIKSVDLSVSGGSEKSNYYLSAAYFDQKGMAIGTGFNKYTLNFNSDYHINDWIKIGNSLNIYSTKTEGDPSYYNLATRKVPLTRAYEDDGDYGIIRDSNLEHIHANPIWLTKNNEREIKGKGLQGNLYITLSPIKGLELTGRGSMDYYTSYRTQFNSGVPSRYGWEGSNINKIEKEHRERVHWIADFLANYSITFNEKHDIKVLLGYSEEESKSESLLGSRTGTPNDNIRFLDAGDPLSQLNENGFTDWAFSSIFGRVNYSFDNKYLLTATVRRDGTSRLAEGNKFGVFPSASVAWRLSEEGFLKNSNTVNDLKLRVSYGTLGNVLSVDEYATIPILTQLKAVLNQGGAQAYTLTAAINSDLKWERSVKKDLGMDISLLNDKIYGSVDYYIEDTYDLLFTNPIALSTGLSSNPLINAGQIRNKGYDISLGYRGQKSDWSYDVNFNLSHVKNEVIDLEGRDLRTSGLVEGYPVRSYFGYKSDGLIRDDSQLAIYQQGDFKNKQIGDIYLLDIDGYDANGELTGIPDGKVDDADRTIIGNKFPDFIYGAVGTLNYKNWGLQVQFQGVQGIDLQYGPDGSATDLVVLTSSWARNEDARILNRYHPINNPNGTWPRLSKDDSGQNKTFSEFWLADASYLRIKNINLNYNLPSEYCNKLGMKSLGLYFSIQNAYTFTKYDGPEVDITADPLTGIPQPRTYTLGLKASF